MRLPCPIIEAHVFLYLGHCGIVSCCRLYSFFYDGRRVQDEDTPESLELEDGMFIPHSCTLLAFRAYVRVITLDSDVPGSCCSPFFQVMPLKFSLNVSPEMSGPYRDMMLIKTLPLTEVGGQ